jgi:FkbM family methyltransferase
MGDWIYGFATHELREEFIKKYGYGPAEHDYMKHYQVKPGDIYVEGGANVGRTAFLAQAMGAKAVMIEPSPLNIPLIQKEMVDGKHSNAVLVPKALSGESKIAFFILAGGKSDRLGERGDKITPVKVDTLPNILGELEITKVNLFACDIEGQEVEVVKQLDPKVELHLAIASYHLGDDKKVLEQIMNPLKEKGYKTVTYEEGIVFASAL